MSYISGVRDLDKLFADIYQQTMFVAREQALMPNFVTPYEASGWMDRHIGEWTQLNTQTVGEFDDWTGHQEWSKGTAATLSPQEIVTGYIVTDRMLETDPEATETAAAREMGGALAQQVDQDLLGNFSSFDETRGYAGSALTIKRAAAAMEYLRTQYVMSPLQIVVSPPAWYDIWTELGQPEANYAFLGDVANQAMKDMFAGNPLGPAWYVTGNIESVAISDATRGTATAASGSACYGAVFHREALALDTRRRPRTERERDATKRAFEITTTMGYAHGVRRSNYGVALLSSNNTHDDV